MVLANTPNFPGIDPDEENLAKETPAGRAEAPKKVEFVLSLCDSCNKILNREKVDAFLKETGITEAELIEFGQKISGPPGFKVLLSHGCCRACFLQNYPGNEDIAPKE